MLPWIGLAQDAGVVVEARPRARATENSRSLVLLGVETPLSARAALLQALRVPGYGLELMKRVHDSTGGVVGLRMGSIYPALRALEGEGLVRCLRVAARRKGRPRRYYELTPRGVRAAMAA